MTDRLQALFDRQQIEDTIYRYGASVDQKDYVGARSTFTDDAIAQYAGAPEIHGGDAIVKWIDEMCVDKSWQHHFLNVYRVEIDGDEATTLVYHTSHQTTFDAPDTVLQIVARYVNKLRRVDGEWRISDLRMHVGWMEERQFPQGAMAAKEAEQNAAARTRSTEED